MYQIDQVKTGLFGLIGWRQDTVSGIPTIDATNLASSSGMYYQISDANFNTLLTDLSKASIVKVLNAVYSSEDYIENKVLYPYEKDWINTIDNTTSFVGFEIDCPVRKDSGR
jgi:hypothetical protein